jgi:ATP-dependent helicase HrpB
MRNIEVTTPAFLFVIRHSYFPVQVIDVKPELLSSLPIDAYLPEIVACLERSSALVIAAPPGAGKTTRVPRALYKHGFADEGDILILEPRRLATRLAAARVAEELGERVGETAGYAIRFETVGGPETRIRFLTEGVLSRRIIQDPELAGVSVVILDEFHERHLVTDLALAFLRKLQSRRPGLKLIIMSATLDADAIASFLEAPVIRAEGSCFEVRIEYEEKKDDRPLHVKVASAVTRLCRMQLDGHVLVFLPGSYEIRRAAEALKPLAQQTGLLVVPLHGDLPSADQSRAVHESTERKVILSTNVAESSITIPGVSAVVDSGFARMAGYSAWSGLPTLTVERVSKASASQRAGRAGRTRSGRVLRLYTRSDFEGRPEQTVPEIKRADLAETLLTLHGAGIRDPEELPWFEPPSKPALDAAEELLMRLGALDARARLTETGRRMLRFPVHPRLARLMVEGEQLGVASECAVVAALLSEREIRLDPRSQLGAAPLRATARAAGLSDMLEMHDLFCEAEQERFNAATLRRLGLEPRTIETVDRAQRQLCRLLRSKKGMAARPGSKSKVEEALLIAILAAFPDRVAKRRAPGSRDLLMAVGGSAYLSESSAVHHAALMVAVDAEERKGSKGSAETQGVLVRLASAIEPEWLAGLFPDALSQSSELKWNEQAGRVEELRRTNYGQVSLEQVARAAPPSQEASRVLAKAVLGRSLNVFEDWEMVPALLERLALLANHFPSEELPTLAEGDVRAAVESLCASKRSIAELAHLSIVDCLTSQLTKRQSSLLMREAPERVEIAHRKNVRVHYERGKPPWIESRLQDFFGMASVPAICRGQIRLTVHVLAPNGRPVQVTQDLKGFWERHYPGIRRELQRRYPKHAWPDPKDLTL